MMQHETVEMTQGLDPRWRALAARDRQADGSFVYAVTSTGVYCRPSCPSRRPRADRVRFFDTPVDDLWERLLPPRFPEPSAN